MVACVHTNSIGIDSVLLFCEQEAIVSFPSSIVHFNNNGKFQLFSAPGAILCLRPDVN